MNGHWLFCGIAASALDCFGETPLGQTFHLEIFARDLLSNPRWECSGTGINADLGGSHFLEPSGQDFKILACFQLKKSLHFDAKIGSKQPEVVPCSVDFPKNFGIQLSFLPRSN
jgi:hypothetical protein